MFCSFTVESQTEADFVIFFKDLKRSFSPFSGSPVEAIASDLDSATTGEFGHRSCHGLGSRRYTLGDRKIERILHQQTKNKIKLENDIIGESLAMWKNVTIADILVQSQF